MPVNKAKLQDPCQYMASQRHHSPVIVRKTITISQTHCSYCHLHQNAQVPKVLSHFLLCHWLCQWNWDLPQNVIVLWADISADEENKMKSQNQIATMCTAWTMARKSYPAIVVLNLLSGHQCGQKLKIILTQPLSLHLLFARNGDHKPCNNLGPWTHAS